jgi:glyoxylase-like metal-dependent hydrolase (beta-lactamase superfamily II)
MSSVDSKLQVAMFTVGPLQENCYLLTDRESGTAVLVDPGDEAESLLEAVDESGCTLEAIWLTHAHFDHLGAVAGIVRHREVPVLLHPLDRPLYDNAPASALRFGLSVEAPPARTVPLAEGDVLRVGSEEFTLWHVPGHAPGHVAFIGNGLSISGDVLFAGSIGRTDLPLCDARAMTRSLERMATLPPETQVLSGHGPVTTIAREAASNPFLRGMARPVGA